MASTTIKSFTQKGLPLLFRDHPHAAVGKWILGTGGLVVGMIHVGGITRLTQSGLSMTTWSPLGSLPPITRDEWEEEFARYRTFPEWQQRQSMTLKEFQFIYAWEYGHRMLGRVVGVAFCLPWAYFSVRGMIPAGYQGRMALLGSMGAAQGAIGWWMVRSGLGDDRKGDKNEIRVKPIRLATHLSMAVATYSALLWTGMNMLSLPHDHKAIYSALLKDMSSKTSEALRKAARLRLGGLGLVGLTGLTIVSGALVAGNDAGRAFNTFPTMNGEWVPSQIMELVPWERNLVENTATVQWNHRVLGTATALTAASLVIAGLSPSKAALLTPQARQGLYAIGIAATGQFTLGVVTLLNYVPISLAAMHQVGSIVVLTSGVYFVHALRYAQPLVKKGAETVARKSVVLSSLKPSI